MGNKDAENKCLDNVFQYSKHMHGKYKEFIVQLESSEIIDRKGDNEKPDFLLKDNRDKFYGIEHFRVDHLSELHKDNKINSNGVILEKESSKIFTEWNTKLKFTDWDDQKIMEAANALSKLVGQQFKCSINTSYRTFLEAFMRIFNNHIKKIREYRENIKGYKDVKLGFLVEIHHNFNELVLNTCKDAKKNNTGHLPMFEAIVKIIESGLSKGLDFIILYNVAMNGNFTKKVLVLRKNNVRNDLFHQNELIYEYAGEDVSLKPFFLSSIINDVQCDINKKENNEIEFLFNVTHTDVNEKLLPVLLYRALYVAWKSKKGNKNFVCSIRTQFIYELFYDLILEWNKGTVESKDYVIIPKIKSIPKEIYLNRIKDCDKKWGTNFLHYF